MTDNQVYYCDIKSLHIDTEQSLEPFRCKQITEQNVNEMNEMGPAKMSKKKNKRRRHKKKNREYSFLVVTTLDGTFINRIFLSFEIQ